MYYIIYKGKITGKKVKLEFYEQTYFINSLELILTFIDGFTLIGICGFNK